VTHHLPSDVRQYDTHGELVGLAGSQTAPVQPQVLDAIIVPASRLATNLDHAVTLARAARCYLVVICSRQARADDVNQLLEARSFSRAIVIDLPDRYGHRLLNFSTSHSIDSDLPDVCADRKSDLSTKRNLGLILARMLGWSRVFFMDDDIRDFGSAELLFTVSMLGTYRTVGMRVMSFPDNSVVCHAHRETGAFQDVLVSGSALAVDCDAPIGFFPNIYNEDWLFFYHDAAAHLLGCSGLNATQLHYDPFADPQRAAGQEFGDVLAEGLYALLHQRRDAKEATRGYWAHFLEVRRIFLEAIISRSEEAPAHVRQKMVDAVQTALKCLIQIQPGLCEYYVGLWLKDLSNWRQAFKDIPRMSSVNQALGELALDAACADAKSAQRLPRRHVDMPADIPPGPVLIPKVATLTGLSRGGSVLARSDTVAVDSDEASLLQRTIPASGAVPGARRYRGRHSRGKAG
jgi:hypothetical protein